MKNKLFPKLTKPRLNDQEAERLSLNGTTIIGNILITLSGVLLYLDKVFVYFNITIPMPTNMAPLEWDQETFIWFVSQSLTPILLIIASWLKANKWFYIIPLYCYVLQLHFNLLDYKIIDRDYLYYYVIGTTILTVVVVNRVKFLAAKNIKKQIQQEKERLINQ